MTISEWEIGGGLLVPHPSIPGLLGMFTVVDILDNGAPVFICERLFSGEPDPQAKCSRCHKPMNHDLNHKLPHDPEVRTLLPLLPQPPVPSTPPDRPHLASHQTRRERRRNRKRSR